jgi:hypothetical protein
MPGTRKLFCDPAVTVSDIGSPQKDFKRGPNQGLGSINFLVSRLAYNTVSLCLTSDIGSGQ